jgi:hypothetical protein
MSQVTQDYKFKTKEVSVGHITMFTLIGQTFLKVQDWGNWNEVHYIVKSSMVAIEVWKINK